MDYMVSIYLQAFVSQLLASQKAYNLFSMQLLSL